MGVHVGGVEVGAGGQPSQLHLSWSRSQTWSQALSPTLRSQMSRTTRTSCRGPPPRPGAPPSPPQSSLLPHSLQATLLGALSPAGGAREAGLARALLRPSLLSLSLGPPPCHLSSRGQGPRLRKEPHRHSRGLRVQSFPPGKRLGPLGWPPCATSPRQPGESGRGQPPSPSRQPVSPRRRRNPGSSSTS